jgi:hypothetical protein
MGLRGKVLVHGLRGKVWIHRRDAETAEISAEKTKARESI